MGKNYARQRPDTRRVSSGSRTQLAEGIQQRLRRRASISVVDVLKSGDVVFVKVCARLHLDKEGWNFARVGEAVLLADSDIGRLILGEETGFCSLCHLEGALDHDPMFGAVVMAL